MVEIRINAKDFERYVGNLNKTIQAAGMRGIIKGAAQGLNILRKATAKAPPASAGGSAGAFDTGAYSRAWKTRMTEDSVTIFNDSAYAGVIEEGRRPGSKMPPPGVIAQWARRKIGLSAQDAKAVGFLMARAIASRGLKGRHVLRDALPDIKDAIREQLYNALSAAIGGSR